MSEIHAWETVGPKGPIYKSQMGGNTVAPSMKGPPCLLPPVQYRLELFSPREYRTMDLNMKRFISAQSEEHKSDEISPRMTAMGNPSSEGKFRDESSDEYLSGCSTPKRMPEPATYANLIVCTTPIKARDYVAGESILGGGLRVNTPPSALILETESEPIEDSNGQVSDMLIEQDAEEEKMEFHSGSGYTAMQHDETRGPSSHHGSTMYAETIALASGPAGPGPDSILMEADGFTANDLTMLNGEFQPYEASNDTYGSHDYYQLLNGRTHYGVRALGIILYERLGEFQEWERVAVRGCQEMWTAPITQCYKWLMVLRRLNQTTTIPTEYGEYTGNPYQDFIVNAGSRRTAEMYYFFRHIYPTYLQLVNQHTADAARLRVSRFATLANASRIPFLSYDDINDFPSFQRSTLFLYQSGNYTWNGNTYPAVHLGFMHVRSPCHCQMTTSWEPYIPTGDIQEQYMVVGVSGKKGSFKKDKFKPPAKKGNVKKVQFSSSPKPQEHTQSQKGDNVTALAYLADGYIDVAYRQHFDLQFSDDLDCAMWWAHGEKPNKGIIPIAIHYQSFDCNLVTFATPKHHDACAVAPLMMIFGDVRVRGSILLAITTYEPDQAKAMYKVAATQFLKELSRLHDYDIQLQEHKDKPAPIGEQVKTMINNYLTDKPNVYEAVLPIMDRLKFYPPSCLTSYDYYFAKGDKAFHLYNIWTTRKLGPVTAYCAATAIDKLVRYAMREKLIDEHPLLNGFGGERDDVGFIEEQLNVCQALSHGDEANVDLPRNLRGYASLTAAALLLTQTCLPSASIVVTTETKNKMRRTTVSYFTPSAKPILPPIEFYIDHFSFNPKQTYISTEELTAVIPKANLVNSVSAEARAQGAPVHSSDFYDPNTGTGGGETDANTGEFPADAEQEQENALRSSKKKVEQLKALELSYAKAAAIRTVLSTFCNRPANYQIISRHLYSPDAEPRVRAGLTHVRMPYRYSKRFIATVFPQIMSDIGVNVGDVDATMALQNRYYRYNYLADERYETELYDRGHELNHSPHPMLRTLTNYYYERALNYLFCTYYPGDTIDLIDVGARPWQTYTYLNHEVPTRLHCYIPMLSEADRVSSYKQYSGAIRRAMDIQRQNWEANHENAAACRVNIKNKTDGINHYVYPFPVDANTVTDVRGTGIILAIDSFYYAGVREFITKSLTSGKFKAAAIVCQLYDIPQHFVHYHGEYYDREGVFKVYYETGVWTVAVTVTGNETVYLHNVLPFSPSKLGKYVIDGICYNVISKVNTSCSSATALIMMTLALPGDGTTINDDGRLTRVSNQAMIHFGKNSSNIENIAKGIEGKPGQIYTEIQNATAAIIREAEGLTTLEYSRMSAAVEDVVKVSLEMRHETIRRKSLFDISLKYGKLLTADQNWASNSAVPEPKLDLLREGAYIYARTKGNINFEKETFTAGAVQYKALQLKHVFKRKIDYSITGLDGHSYKPTAVLQWFTLFFSVFSLLMSVRMFLNGHNILACLCPLLFGWVIGWNTYFLGTTIHFYHIDNKNASEVLKQFAKETAAVIANPLVQGHLNRVACFDHAFTYPNTVSVPLTVLFPWVTQPKTAVCGLPNDLLHYVIGLTVAPGWLSQALNLLLWTSTLHVILPLITLLKMTPYISVIRTPLRVAAVIYLMFYLLCLLEAWIHTPRNWSLNGIVPYGRAGMREWYLAQEYVHRSLEDNDFMRSHRNIKWKTYTVFKPPTQKVLNELFQGGEPLLLYPYGIFAYEADRAVMLGYMKLFFTRMVYAPWLEVLGYDVINPMTQYFIKQLFTGNIFDNEDSAAETVVYPPPRYYDYESGIFKEIHDEMNRKAFGYRAFVDWETIGCNNERECWKKYYPYETRCTVAHGEMRIGLGRTGDAVFKRTLWNRAAGPVFTVNVTWRTDIHGEDQPVYDRLVPHCSIPIGRFEKGDTTRRFRKAARVDPGIPIQFEYSVQQESFMAFSATLATTFIMLALLTVKYWRKPEMWTLVDIVVVGTAWLNQSSGVYQFITGFHFRIGGVEIDWTKTLIMIIVLCTIGGAIILRLPIFAIRTLSKIVNLTMRVWSRYPVLGVVILVICIQSQVGVVVANRIQDAEYIAETALPLSVILGFSLTIIAFAVIIAAVYLRLIYNRGYLVGRVPSEPASVGQSQESLIPSDEPNLESPPTTYVRNGKSYVYAAEDIEKSVYSRIEEGEKRKREKERKSREAASRRYEDGHMYEDIEDDFGVYGTRPDHITLTVLDWEQDQLPVKGGIDYGEKVEVTTYPYAPKERKLWSTPYLKFKRWQNRSGYKCTEEHAMQEAKEYAEPCKMFNPGYVLPEGCGPKMVDQTTESLVHGLKSRHGGHHVFPHPTYKQTLTDWNTQLAMKQATEILSNPTQPGTFEEYLEHIDDRAKAREYKKAYLKSMNDTHKISAHMKAELKRWEALYCIVEKVRARVIWCPSFEFRAAAGYYMFWLLAEMKRIEKSFVTGLSFDDCADRIEEQMREVPHGVFISGDGSTHDASQDYDWLESYDHVIFRETIWWFGRAVGWDYGFIENLLSIMTSKTTTWAACYLKTEIAIIVGEMIGLVPSGKVNATTFGNTGRENAMNKFWLKPVPKVPNYKNKDNDSSGDDFLLLVNKQYVELVQNRILMHTSHTSQPTITGWGYVMKELHLTSEYFTFLSKHGFYTGDKVCFWRQFHRIVLGSHVTTSLEKAKLSQAEYNYVVSAGLASQSSGQQHIIDYIQARRRDLPHRYVPKEKAEKFWGHKFHPTSDTRPWDNLTQFYARHPLPHRRNFVNSPEFWSNVENSEPTIKDWPICGAQGVNKLLDQKSKKQIINKPMVKQYSGKPRQQKQPQPRGNNSRGRGRPRGRGQGARPAPKPHVMRVEEKIVVTQPKQQQPRRKRQKQEPAPQMPKNSLTKVEKSNTVSKARYQKSLANVTKKDLNAEWHAAMQSSFESVAKAAKYMSDVFTAPLYKLPTHIPGSGWSSFPMRTITKLRGAAGQVANMYIRILPYLPCVNSAVASSGIGAFAWIQQAQYNSQGTLVERASFTHPLASDLDSRKESSATKNIAAFRLSGLSIKIVYSGNFMTVNGNITATQHRSTDWSLFATGISGSAPDWEKATFYANPRNAQMSGNNIRYTTQMANKQVCSLINWAPVSRTSFALTEVVEGKYPTDTDLAPVQWYTKDGTNNAGTWSEIKAVSLFSTEKPDSFFDDPLYIYINGTADTLAYTIHLTAMWECVPSSLLQPYVFTTPPVVIPDTMTRNLTAPLLLETVPDINFAGRGGVIYTAAPGPRVVAADPVENNEADNKAGNENAEKHDVLNSSAKLSKGEPDKADWEAGENKAPNPTRGIKHGFRSINSTPGSKIAQNLDEASRLKTRIEEHIMNDGSVISYNMINDTELSDRISSMYPTLDRGHIENAIARIHKFSPKDTGQARRLPDEKLKDWFDSRTEALSRIQTRGGEYWMHKVGKGIAASIIPFTSDLDHDLDTEFVTLPEEWYSPDNHYSRAEYEAALQEIKNKKYNPQSGG